MQPQQTVIMTSRQAAAHAAQQGAPAPASQQHRVNIVMDGTLCGCFDDMESCMLTWLTCFVHPFSTNRQRAGVMPCLPSAGIAGALVLFYLVLEGVGYGNSSEYRSCSDEKITRQQQLGTEEGRAIQACYLRDPFNFAYSSW